LRGEIPDPFRMGRGEIVVFDRIGGEVIQFPFTLVRGDEFPVTDTHGAIALVLPEQRTRLGGGRARPEEGHERSPLHRLNHLAPIIFRIGRARNLEHRRHEIDDVPRLLNQRAPGLNARRPVSNERGRDAAFVGLSLETPERGIAHVRPLEPAAGVGKPRADRCALFAPAESTGTALGGTAVVGKEKDERVPELPESFQLRDESTDVLIDAVDLRGVDLHAMGEFATGLCGYFVPGFRLRIARARDSIGRDDSQFLLSREPPRAHLVPSGIVASRVFGNVFGFGLERPVRSNVREIEKKWLLRFGEGFLDEGHRMISEVIGDIEIVGHFDALRSLDKKDLFADLQGILEIDSPTRRSSPITVEAPIERPLPGSGADVPFPCHQGGVTRRAQGLREGDAAIVEIPLIRGHPVVGDHVADARLVRVESGKERGPRRTAARRVVKIA